MASKLKFFGVYENSFDFKKLNENEQKKILINNKIYIEGISNLPYDLSLVNPIYINRNNNIKFLGKDFNLNNRNYTINPKFIDEVYNEIIKRFENERLINIDDFINTLSLKFNFIENEDEKNDFLLENKKKANLDYSKQLDNKIFQDFHNSKKAINDFKEVVIKKHLKYDIAHLSDYIFGLDNILNFETISIYNSFLRTSRIISFCNSNILIIKKESESSNPSLPKAIALLNEIGFFELEKIKYLNTNNIARIISYIQMKDMDNITNLRAISGNIRALTPNNKEDGFKYTSHKWIDYSKEKLNEIKKGNI